MIGVLVIFLNNLLFMLDCLHLVVIYCARFQGLPLKYAGLAQLVEQLTCNQ